MSGRGAAVRRIALPGRRLRSALVPGRRARRRAGVAVLVLALLTAGYFAWLRDSSLVAVEEVSVAGATTADGERVRSALIAAARDMTTLHVDRAELLQSVAPFPVVKDLRVTTDFPHGMSITVVEHRPVAVFTHGGARLPVAADGTLLRGLVAASNLPTVNIAADARQRELAPGLALDAIRVAGATPAVLRGRYAEIVRRPEQGIVVPITGGPDLVFGNADRATAKWAAAARVLADPDAVGAEYVDVRIPERPAAGGLSVETVAPVPSAEPAVPSEQIAPEAPLAEDPATAPAPELPVAEVPVEPVIPPHPEPPPGGGDGAVVSPQP